MTTWLQELQRAYSTGQFCVLVSVVRTRGSSPREVGAKMLVTEDEVVGTIGGGQLEYQCTAMACDWFRRVSDTQAPWTHIFPLGASSGQCCGGTVDVLFEPIQPSRTSWVESLINCLDRQQSVVMVTSIDADQGVAKWLVTDGSAGDMPMRVQQMAVELLDSPKGTQSATYTDTHTRTRFILESLLDYDFEVALFGAGHVGSALVNALHSLPCRIHWIDSRPGVFPSRLPANVAAVAVSHPKEALSRLPTSCFFLVMTHSHALDFEICTEILGRGGYPYLGLIGSRTKRRRFERRWRALNIDQRLIDNLTCPIGLPGITGKRPEEIAIATVAQVLEIRGQQLGRDSSPEPHRHSLSATVPLNACK